MRRFRPLLIVALLMPGAALAQTGDVPAGHDPAVLDGCLAGKDGWLARAACIGVPSGRCMETPDGSSNVGMSACMSAELAQWDARMNASYQTAMTDADRGDAADRDAGTAAPAERADTLRDMQRRWIAFRDAACANAGAWWSSGSGRGPATVQCMMDQTARQALMLEALAAQWGLQ